MIDSPTRRYLADVNFELHELKLKDIFICMLEKLCANSRM